jgi:hypothetical protein
MGAAITPQVVVGENRDPMPNSLLGLGMHMKQRHMKKGKGKKIWTGPADR